MRTFRLWIICLLMPLLAPPAWSEMVRAMPAGQMGHVNAADEALHDMARAALDPPEHTGQNGAASQTATPCHHHLLDAAMADDTPDGASDGAVTGHHPQSKAKPQGTHRQGLRCGDCSACHVLALLPPDWPAIGGPALVQVTPGWHATPDRGRPKGCELYRPPRA